MTDQQRGDVTRAGHPCKTPNLDRFRERAVEFTEAFCPSPHCCPSRASFFTGLMPSRHGVWNNVAVQNTLSRGPNDGVRLWSQGLTEAGYECHFAGKWHVSYDDAPRDFGWREHHITAGPAKDGPGFMGKTWGDFRDDAGRLLDVGEREPGQIARPGWTPYRHYGTNPNPFGDNGVVDAALNILGDLPADPWCLYCGTLGPHDPYTPPAEFLDLYKDVAVELPDSFGDPMNDRPGLYRRTRDIFGQLTPDEHREAIRRYWAFCTYEDGLFGRLLDALDASGRADETVVMFCSDHGDYAGEHGLWTKGLPCFRGAYHVPMLVAGPGVGGGRTVDAPVSLCDVGPTLLELAGLDVPEVMTGRSLVPWLGGGTPEWRSAMFTQSNGNEQYGIQRSVVADGWKYVHNGYDYDELYDLRGDPGETRNLAADPEHRGRLLELCARMWRFAADQGDDCINPYITTAMAPLGPAAAFAQGVESGW